MTPRPIAAALLLGLGLATTSAASAQDGGRGPYRPRLTPEEIDNLQPGMRTMIQQGGIEPGPLLGVLWAGRPIQPPEWYDVRDPVAYDAPVARPIAREGRPAVRRHARTRRAARRHFAL